MVQGKLMGILNLTDNSFYAPSRVRHEDTLQVVKRAQKLFDDGADIIDIGACSTAPGNACVSEHEEWKRLENSLHALFEAFPQALFSIDTFRPEIVRKILKIDGCPKNIIINDVKAADMNNEMLSLIADNGLTYVAMDSSDDPLGFFGNFSHVAEKYGIGEWILDPGFGFGKTLERNWEILHNLRQFRQFGHPVLVALSHKRMVYQPLGLTPQTCAEQSVAAEKTAFENGADIVRTHDLAAFIPKSR